MIIIPSFIFLIMIKEFIFFIIITINYLSIWIFIRFIFKIIFLRIDNQSFISYVSPPSRNYFKLILDFYLVWDSNLGTQYSPGSWQIVNEVIKINWNIDYLMVNMTHSVFLGISWSRECSNDQKSRSFPWLW